MTSKTWLWLFIDNALRANYIMLLDIDYVVSEEQEILIVDQFTGRTMEGRRYSDGSHQAIEAKEGVPIQDEAKTSASITYQTFSCTRNCLVWRYR